MIVKRTGVKYYTLKEIYADNENIEKMFDDVKNLFATPISSGYTLFRIFLNKYGNAHLNYPVFVHFTNEECEEVRDAVAFHYLEYRYKYDTLIASENLTYNPLENYRMTEKGGNTRTPDLTTNMTRGTTDTTTRGTTDTRTPNLTKGSSGEYKPRVVYTESDSNTNTESVSAFDVETFANNKKNVISGSKTTTPSLTQDGKGDSTTTTETETGTDTTTHTGADTTAHTGTDSTTETGSETTTHNLTRYGNIGVTTSQQMIESERQVADFSALSEFMKGVYNAIMLIY